MKCNNSFLERLNQFYYKYFILLANSFVRRIAPPFNKIEIVFNSADAVINCFSYKILAPE